MRAWFAIVVLLYAASVMLVSPGRVLDLCRSAMHAMGAFSLHLQGMPFLSRPDEDLLPETSRLRLAIRFGGVLLILPALAAVLRQALP